MNESKGKGKEEGRRKKEEGRKRAPITFSKHIPIIIKNKEAGGREGAGLELLRDPDLGANHAAFEPPGCPVEGGANPERSAECSRTLALACTIVQALSHTTHTHTHTCNTYTYR